MTKTSSESATGTITAFVSWAHSHDSDEPEAVELWQESVFTFAHQLRRLGIDVDMDLFHLHDTAVDWTVFGPRGIEQADYVLLVTSSAYKERWEGGGDPRRGAGAAREANVLKAQFDEDRDLFRRRVKLILLPGVALDDSPAELQASVQRFSISTFDLDGLSSLLRTLAGLPEWVKPDLGVLPSLPPRTVLGLSAGKQTESPRPLPANVDATRDTRAPESVEGNRKAWPLITASDGVAPNSSSNPTADHEDRLPRRPVALRVRARTVTLAPDGLLLLSSAARGAARSITAVLRMPIRAGGSLWRAAPAAGARLRFQLSRAIATLAGVAPRFGGSTVSRIVLVTSVALVACAVIAAIALIDNRSARAANFSSGDLTLHLRASWHRQPARGGLGVPLTSEISLKENAVEVIVGRLVGMAPLPAEAPPSLVATHGRPRSPGVAAFGAGWVKDYIWSQGERSLSIWIAVTADGEYLIACRGRLNSVTTAAACKETLSGAAISGTKLEYPGASPTIAGQLREILAARAKRVGQVSGSYSGKDLSRRATALSWLADTDEQAARRLGDLLTPSHDQAVIGLLAARLRTEVVLLRSLAQAASRAQTGLFNQLRARLAGERLDIAQQALATVGFTELPLSEPVVARAHRSTPRRIRSTVSEPNTETHPPPSSSIATPHKVKRVQPRPERPEIITSKPE